MTERYSNKILQQRVKELEKEAFARRRSEKAQRQRERELTIRNRIAKIFLNTPDDKMYQEVLQVVLDAMKSKYGLFGYINEDGAMVCPSMTRDIWDKCRIPNKEAVFPREGWGGIWGKALLEKKSLYSNEPFSVPEGHIAILRALDVPVINQGEVIGNLLVANKETDYDENDKQFLKTTANQIAPVLNARLQRDRQEKQRRQAEEKRDHLKSVLEAIRNVNQLITTEKDRDKLLKSVCENLTETRGYYNAWIALTDESGRLIAAAESGLGKDFIPIVKGFKHADLPPCGRKALSHSGVEVIEDPQSTCTECPLAVKYAGRGGLTVRLENNGKVYGLLFASIPGEFISEIEEQALFKEVAGDVAFAIYSIEIEHERKRMDEALRKAHDELEKRVEQRTDELSRANERLMLEIEERKQADENLRESEIWLNSIFNSLEEAVLVVAPDRKLINLNNAAERMFGYCREELINLSAEVLHVDHEHYLEFGRRINEAFDKGEAANFKYVLKRKNGEIFPTEHTISLLRNNKGESLGMVSVVHDNTARSLAEEEKNVLEAQLRQAQKMEAVGTLAGGIAHDFNNLLQIISGFTEMLLMKKDRSDPDYNRLKQIDQTAQQASELTERLLIFSRRVESKLRPKALNQEVEQVLKLLERTIPKMISLEFRPAKDLKIINADRVQIEQILMNLGVNARDALPEGGRLLFETENVILDEQYCQTHPGAVPGEYVLLSVSDTGCGMDQDILEHIFEPFFTTKQVGKGTGLGLAMVYGIVKSHGGYITCDSEPGQGTTFKVYFPVFMTKSPVPKRIEPKKVELSGGREMILVVDDAPIILEMVEAMLEGYGYKTILAESGEKAIEIFGNQKDLIDLVILDVGMPGMGGLKCLERLLELDPTVKVIIASGYALNGKIKESLESGAAGYMRKPYRLADILGKVKEVVDKK